MRVGLLHDIEKDINQVMKDLLPIIQTLVGALIAFGVTLFQLRRRDKELQRERFANQHEVAQNWYHEHYLKEGLYLLIEALAQLNDYYFRCEHSLLLPDTIPTYPTKAVERVRILLPDPHFLNIFRNLYLGTEACLKRYEFGECVALTDNALRNLRNLHGILINKVIDRKEDVYKISQDEAIAEVSIQLNSLNNAICDLGEKAVIVSETKQWVKDNPR